MKLFLIVLFQVEQDTSQSMQMLLKLDNIKSRMKDASDALQVWSFSLFNFTTLCTYTIQFPCLLVFNPGKICEDYYFN